MMLGRSYSFIRLHDKNFMLKNNYAIVSSKQIQPKNNNYSIEFDEVVNSKIIVNIAKTNNVIIINHQEINIVLIDYLLKDLIKIIVDYLEPYLMCSIQLLLCHEGCEHTEPDEKTLFKTKMINPCKQMKYDAGIKLKFDKVMSFKFNYSDYYAIVYIFVESNYPFYIDRVFADLIYNEVRK